MPIELLSVRRVVEAGFYRRDGGKSACAAPGSRAWRRPPKRAERAIIHPASPDALKYDDHAGLTQKERRGLNPRRAS